MLREDNRYLYFTAETPGFSPFAITGKLIAKEHSFEILSEPETKNPEYHTPNITADAEHAPGKKEKIAGIPGFEWIYCIIGLLAGFVYMRK